MILRARLIRRTSADGLIGVKDHVPLGKEYRLDPTTLHLALLFSVDRARRHEKWMILDVDGRQPFPVDLLEAVGYEP